ncbi:mechanosensitive ion channel family protein [Massilia sp. W12]|uniref:mechanosensitive ion channel family protein n=1 Tax=Massilia sp. W12 TaxID=3126507 RepID=UPI0030D3F70C
MDFSKLQQNAIDVATQFGVKIVAAILFWLLGRWLIGMVGNLLQNAMQKQKVDATVMRYLGSVVTVTLNVLLIIGILGYFGIQTTTFAALLAAAGVAIGMAWSGLLANFAAGAFLIVLRPYKVGDIVTVAGVTGTVKEIGLFTTSIDTADNILTMIGNNKIFSDTIQNYSSNPFRRVDLRCQLSGAADHAAAMRLLREKVAQVPNVLSTPAVEVDILEGNLLGPLLAVRPYCAPEHYGQVFFDTNRVIRETMLEAGFPPPMPGQMVFMQQP